MVTLSDSEPRSLESPVPIRLIPRLDIKGENVVKGVRLEGLRVVGKPNALAERYYRDGADEIILIDVVASLYGRNNILDVVERAARQTFVPLTVGGGLRTLDDITSALRAGADKVAINTAAIRRPHFLTEAAERFGSQCIVLSIEAKLRSRGLWEALTDNGRETTGRDVLEWVDQAVALGAGEVLVTSVDHEGTRRGFEIDLIRAIQRRTSVPVIACGGPGNVGHIIECLRETGVDAIAFSSMLHYQLASLETIKKSIQSAGFLVRAA